MPSQSQPIHLKNRNFICSCGKAYLSYAALFTHIKQKHGGKAPGQIIRPRSQNKRGRPRKNDKLATQKPFQTESYNGILDNNNLKNINLANDLNYKQNFSCFQKIEGQGFRSYKQEKQFSDKKIHNKKSQRSIEQERRIEHLRAGLKQDDNDSMQFANPNNQLSNNTLALANIIIGLQQLFKQVTNLQIVKDQYLQKFSAYIDLKQFHTLQLLQKDPKKRQAGSFLLGNIVCAFLNFCHQTLDQRSGYQQIVLLIVCLLQHIKSKNSMQYLSKCKKQVIHQCLPSFFQQYLDKVIIKSKSNFWIFRENNSFKVLIWFLNWLSVIQLNYVKNQSAQDYYKNQELKEDNHSIEFDVPLFANHIQKKQQFKKNQENSNIDVQQQLEDSLSSQKSQQEEQNEDQLIQNQEYEKGSQRSEQKDQDPELDQNESGKHFIEMQRLSSEVR